MKPTDDDLVVRVHREEVERMRREGFVLPPAAPITIPYTELPPGRPDSPLDLEWETYRREVGRLLADGKEWQFVLIHQQEIVGFYATKPEALGDGYRLFPNQGFLVHQVRAREPLHYFARAFPWPS